MRSTTTGMRLITLTLIIVSIIDAGHHEQEVLTASSMMQELVDKIVCQEAEPYSKEEMQRRIRKSWARYAMSNRCGVIREPFAIYVVGTFREQSDIRLFFDAYKKKQEEPEEIWPFYYGWNTHSDGTHSLWCGVYVTPEIVMQAYEGK